MPAAVPAAVQTLIYKLNDKIFNPIIMLMFALAVVYFLAGVYKYIKGYDNDTERNEGKTHMLYGVVGVFIMISVWGIMHMIVDTFGITGAPLP